jgi:hypothetical protein
MDPFPTLPPQILLDIIKLLPDFPALQAFLHSSPAVARIFEECGNEIVDTIALQSLSLTMYNLLQQMKLLFNDLGHPAFLHTLEAENEQRRITSEPAPPPTLRRLVSAASNIQHLSYCCLQSYLYRVYRLKPAHPLEPRIRFQYHAPTHYDPQLAGPRYEPGDTGPPSWVEWQRVLRALWYIQIDLELQKSADSENYPSQLARNAIHDFQEHVPRYIEDEMECARDFLLEASGMQSLPLNGHLFVRPLRLLNPPYQRFSDLPWPSCQPLSGEIARIWDQSPKALEHRSPAGVLWRALCLHGPNDPINILGGKTWKSYRWLGFAIWDLQRMCKLELLKIPKAAPELPNELGSVPSPMRNASLDFLKFTWMSVFARE